MRSRILRSLPYAGLIGLTVLVGFLTVQRRSLRAELQEYHHRAEWLHPGFLVPAFDAVTLEGDTVRIGESSDGTPQVLFFLNTTCPYCLESLPHWDALFRRLSENRDTVVEVYGLSLDSGDETRAYAREHGLSFPLTTLPDERMVALYRARAVPTTVLLSANGTVLYAAIGSLERKRSIADSLIAALETVEHARTSVAGGGGVGPENPFRR